MVIKESTKGYSNKLREYFQSKGITTHVLLDFKDAKKLLRELARPIVLYELPDSADETQKIVDSLVAETNIQMYPLLIIGKHAMKHDEALNAAFKLATAIQKPAPSSDLLEAVRYISEAFTYPTEAQVPLPETAAPKSSSDLVVPEKEEEPKLQVSKVAPPVQTKISTDSIEIPDKVSLHEVYKGFNSIPDLFFNQLSKLNLLEKTISGSEYTKIMHLDSLKQDAYLSQNAKVKDVVAEMTATLPASSITRLHRIAYLVNNILDALNKNTALREDGKIAALLYNWTLSKEHKTLLRKDYLTNRSRTVRKDVCSRIKDSAMKIILDLKFPVAGEIVAKVARLIGREEKVSDDELTVIASTIASVDMIDRACWQSNHFNPRSAYKLMAMAKDGELSEIHPAVLCCIIKMLAEAIASSTQFLLIPQKVRKDPALIDARRRARETVIEEGEKRVEISDLTPGMRLSRPLITFDGRAILEEDLVLDQDLIWRIWQLSLVRPLNSPLVVAEPEKPETSS